MKRHCDAKLDCFASLAMTTVRLDYSAACFDSSRYAR